MSTNRDVQHDVKAYRTIPYPQIGKEALSLGSLAGRIQAAVAALGLEGAVGVTARWRGDCAELHSASSPRRRRRGGASGKVANFKSNRHRRLSLRQLRDIAKISELAR
eukprot:1548600-Pleurochrysis_carterae.AAC.1